VLLAIPALMLIGVLLGSIVWCVWWCFDRQGAIESYRQAESDRQRREVFKAGQPKARQAQVVLRRRGYRRR
jgi:hypothetical protein